MLSINLSEKIVNSLENNILSGKLLPGSKLPPEREMAVQYNVSRPIIHNAIIMLQEKGLVKILPRHGIEVADYRVQGKLNLLDSIIDLHKEDIPIELKTSLIDFSISNINSIISLICSSKQKLDNTLYSLANDIKACDSAEATSDKLFQYYQQMSIISGNEVYPLLINTLKLGFINVSMYLLKDTALRLSCAEALKSLADALMEHSEEKAREKNKEIIELSIRMWR